MQFSESSVASVYVNNSRKSFSFGSLSYLPLSAALKLTLMSFALFGSLNS
jgi:hypothetical protein